MNGPQDSDDPGLTDQDRKDLDLLGPTEDNGEFATIVSPMVIDRILFAEGTVPLFLDGDETVIGSAKFVHNNAGMMEITIHCDMPVGIRLAELVGQNLIGLAVVSRVESEDKDHPVLYGDGLDDLSHKTDEDKENFNG